MKMNRKLVTALFATAVAFGTSAQLSAQRVWTLQECIDYAVKNNVQLQKSRAAEQTSAINVLEAKAARLPSLSGSVSQSLTYRPFQETSSNFVNGGIATSAADKATQSGSYGVNAQWTVWNGNKTKMNIENAQLNQQLAELDTKQSANTIKEQIAQLYTQILYMTEAEKVNRTLLTQDSIVLARGEEMVSVGQLAKADLAHDFV